MPKTNNGGDNIKADAVPNQSSKSQGSKKNKSKRKGKGNKRQDQTSSIKDSSSDLAAVSVINSA